MKMTIEISEEYINYLGNRVMDEYEYRGLTIREWADKILNDAPTADVVDKDGANLPTQKE